MGHRFQKKQGFSKKRLGFGEVILSFVLGHSIKADGMSRTGVVACQAGHASAGVLPYWFSCCRHRHIVNLAGVNASSATDASIGIDAECLVGNKYMMEEAANDLRLQVGACSLMHVIYCSSAFSDCLGYLRHP